MNPFSVANPILVTLLLSATLWITACKDHYIAGPIDEEAKKEAEIYWASSFSKCGDSFYGVYSKTGRTIEFKSNMKYQLKDEKVVECGLCVLTTHRMDGRSFTQADKLNGLEWVGKTSVDFSVYRLYRDDGTWGEWSDTTWIFIDSTYIDLRKIQGKWQFGSEETGRFRAVPCSQVHQ